MNPVVLEVVVTYGASLILKTHEGAETRKPDAEGMISFICGIKEKERKKEKAHRYREQTDSCQRWGGKPVGKMSEGG